MNTYWKDYQGKPCIHNPIVPTATNTFWKGNDESFWEHEWAKHGTCISTFDTDCYTGYTPQEEVVDFFTETVNLFKTLNSYQYLSDAGIVPSASKNYSLTDVQAALKKPRGVDVTVQCQNGALDEIWYHFNVQGSIQTGKFIPANPDGAKGSCSDSLMYLPKSGSPTTTTSTTSTGTTTTTSTTSPTSTGGFTGKGTLPVTSGGSQSGCIISGGTWYTSGTCASFTATQGSSGFTLQSSKGPCAISSGVLSCASGLTATTFTATNGLLTYNGANTFYAAAPPSGSTQQKVNTASSASSGTALQIGWAGSSWYCIDAAIHDWHMRYVWRELQVLFQTIELSLHTCI